MEVKIIEYKNKKIVHADYRGANSEKDVANIAQQGLKLRQESSGIAGVLANYTGVNLVFSKSYINRLRDGLDQYSKDKIALVGMTGIDKTMAGGVNAVIGTSQVRLFDAEAEAEAKEWLVSETDK